MAYNKNFNKCDMAEYLIKNGKDYINNSTKTVMQSFISKFEYPDFNTVLDVDRFITSNKRFNVTINSITYNDVLPYYVLFIENINGFPGNGFFDAFRTQNFTIYDLIAPGTPSNQLIHQQMQIIVDIAKDALGQHIHLNFSTDVEINSFITNEMINQGSC